MKAQELKHKYDADLKDLQDNICKHENISDWIDEYWAPAHSTGYKVKACNDCWKTIERKPGYPDLVFTQGSFLFPDENESETK